MSRVYALLRIDAHRIAVPLENVWKACSTAVADEQAPNADADLDGIVMHGVQAIPRVDLRRWFATTSEDLSRLPEALIVRDAGRLLAISIGRVDGLTEIDPALVTPIHRADPGQGLFRATAAIEIRVADRPPARMAVAVLDAGALITKAGVWVDECVCGDPPAEGARASGLPEPASEVRLAADAGDTGAAALRGPLTPCGIFRAGGRLLAVALDGLGDVQHMHDENGLQTFIGMPDTMAGIARWRGADLAVIRLPALEHADAPGRRQGPLSFVVLRSAQAVLGLIVEAAVALEPLPLSAVRAAPEAGMDADLGVSGLLHVAGRGEVWVVDADRLLATHGMPWVADPPAVGSAPGQTGLAHAGDVDAPPAGSGMHAILRAGHVWAMPIAAITEVVDPPGAASQPRAAGRSRASALGTFEWRNRTVPLYDLRQMLGGGRSEQGPDSAVLVVTLKDGPIGLLVEKLLSMADLGATRPSHRRARDGQAVDLLHPRAPAPGSVTYRVLDPRALRVAGHAR